MSRFIKKKASASITVLIMTVVIICLGLSFVFISKTNYVLTSKNNSWILDYYKIEGVMNEDIANLENYLKENNISELKYDDKNNLIEMLSSEVSFDEGDVPDVEGYKAPSVRINLYVDEKIIANENISNQIGISSEVIYDYSTHKFILISKKEIPPELEYESFY